MYITFTIHSMMLTLTNRRPCRRWAKTCCEEAWGSCWLDLTQVRGGLETWRHDWRKASRAASRDTICFTNTYSKFSRVRCRVGGRGRGLFVGWGLGWLGDIQLSMSYLLWTLIVSKYLSVNISVCEYIRWIYLSEYIWISDEYVWISTYRWIYPWISEYIWWIYLSIYLWIYLNISVNIAVCE